MKQIKRWTIRDGKVVQIDDNKFKEESLSIAAPCKNDAEEEFLRMARNVLFFKPQIHFKNNAFLHIYHDGHEYCADSGLLESYLYPFSKERFSTLKEVFESKMFLYYASDEYQQERKRQEGEAKKLLEMMPVETESDKEMRLLIESQIPQTVK
jgi:hypothetical protein